MNVDNILRTVAHRPWPLPQGRWIMVQIWHDLLFAHWPIPVEIMREHVPAQLSLDMFDGQCWIGVVPFHMSGVRPRWLPALPGLSRFPELNVRTYVTVGGKAGVYFFSLDAANLTAVLAARVSYHLPYFWARMETHTTNHEVTYSSTRKVGNALFSGNYRPTTPPEQPQRNTLEHWLTERYRLYTVDRGRTYFGDIHHLPWPLQNAEADFRHNSMAAAAGISLPDCAPLLHFSRRQEVLIWPLTRVP